MVFLIIAFVAVIAAVVSIAVYNRKKSTLLTVEIAAKNQEAETANNELTELIHPRHFFTEIEEVAYKERYGRLYQKITTLCTNKHFAGCITDKKAILSFKNQFERLPELRDDNNSDFKAIEYLNANIESAHARTLEYFLDKEYLTESRRVQYEEDSKDINVALLEAEARKLLEYTEYPNKCKTVLTAHKESADRKNENNQRFISKQLTEHSYYFDTVLRHPLNNQQREAVVTLEDNVLTISSAGSGKTSTIEGKVKYLVEKRRVDPKRILLITYTRKASESLTERLNIKGLTCLTFHKLASNIIESTRGFKPTFCEANIFPKIYQELKKDHDFLNAMNTYLLSFQSQMKDEFEYKDAKTYYADRKKYGIMASFHDMDGNPIFTKSEQERKICNFLSMNGISYRYEEPYRFEEYEPGYRAYKPDFTIYFKKDGKEHQIYLEHFGIDKNGKVPQWFGDGKEGGWEKANHDYNEGIVWKRNVHRKYKTTLIETTSADFAAGRAFDVLLKQLEQNGVTINPLSANDIYKSIINDNSKREKALIDMISSFINLMKANCIPSPEILLPENCILPGDQRDKYIIEKIITPFFIKYQTALAKRGEMDFTDAILKARDICNEGNRPEYEYILVDEFQDISIDRYEFLKSLRTPKPLTRLFCVGDDWQSIYRFAGSNMALFKDFEKFFGYTRECRMETTFRFGEPLASMSSAFVLRNPEQKEKSVKPYTDKAKTELKTLYYNSLEDLRKMVAGVLSYIPEGRSVYILGRYSFDADVLKSDTFNVAMKGTKTFIYHNGKEYPYLTAHQSKGLEADYVILLNCNSGVYGFPSTISDDPVLSRVLSENDHFEFGEERRLFYVAITRGKRMTYVLYDKKHPSTFVTEIEPDLPLAERCPVCQAGRRTMVHSGIAKNGSKFYTYTCSNSSSGCDYRQTIFDRSGL